MNLLSTVQCQYPGSDEMKPKTLFQEPLGPLWEAFDNHKRAACILCFADKEACDQLCCILYYLQSGWLLREDDHSRHTDIYLAFAFWLSTHNWKARTGDWWLGRPNQSEKGFGQKIENTIIIQATAQSGPQARDKQEGFLYAAFQKATCLTSVLFPWDQNSSGNPLIGSVFLDSKRRRIGFKEKKQQRKEKEKKENKGCCLLMEKAVKGV